MKQFFVDYYGDFSNAYKLVYAETPEDFKSLPAGAERITRREAIKLCAEENHRRKNDTSFAYFASNVIFPADSGNDYDPERCGLIKRGYIWERV